MRTEEVGGVFNFSKFFVQELPASIRRAAAPIYLVAFM
jgi:hypothetical protein